MYAVPVLTVVFGVQVMVLLCLLAMRLLEGDD